MPHTSELESALLAELVNQSELGIAVCGPDGVLTTLNDTLADLLGCRPAHDLPATLTGCGALQEGDGRTVRRGRDPLSRALKGEKVAEVLTAVAVSGETHALKCTAFPIRNAQGTLLGAAMVAVDVTASIAERRHLEHLRNELVETVNHEVRTPLAVIAGHMELIDDQDESEPETLSWSLEAIGRATTQLSSVVDTISEIADGSLRRFPERD